MTNATVDFNKLVNDLKDAGIQKGDLLNVKASLKSIGKVEGGAKTLLDALLEVVGQEGTIVTDSFVRMYTKDSDSLNNITTQETGSYAGALANAILKHPNACRSTHPVQKFAAIGAKAKELTDRHTIKSRPYNVLYEMVLQNGKNLRIGGLDKVVGVGTTHVTLDELKIQQRRPVSFVHFEQDGEYKKFEADWASGCHVAFNNLFPHYYKGNAIIKESKVGSAVSVLSDMKKTYEIEKDLFNKDLKYTQCNNPYCINCTLGWKHVKKRYIKTAWILLLKKQFDLSYQAISYIFNKNYVPR